MPYQTRLKPRRLQVEKLEGRELMAAIRLVTDTTSFPAQATVSINQTYDTNNNGMKDNNDPTFICSGALFENNHVLTAAHCLYDSSRGGFAAWVTVMPGRNGNNLPFGSAEAINLLVPTAWTQGNNSADIGVIRLNSDIGETVGWYGTKVASTSQLQSKNLFLRHYPGSPQSNGSRQYVSSGPASSVTASTIKYNHNRISTFGGSSGAPLYFKNTTQIVGVHVRGSLGQAGPNESTRLTQSFFNLIHDYANQSQSQTTMGGGISKALGETRDVKVEADAQAISEGAWAQMAAEAAMSGLVVDVTVAPTTTSAKSTSTNASTTTGSQSNSLDFLALLPLDAVEVDCAVYTAAADDIFAATDSELALVSEDLPLVLA